MARAMHRKTIRTSATLGTAMETSARTVTLNTAFVAAVKAGYVSGNMRSLKLDRIIPALLGSLRAHHKGSLPLPEDDRDLRVAIDTALTYLEGRRQITLPSVQTAKAA